MEPLLASDEVREFVGDYLRPLRSSAVTTADFLTKLLYCYHRFYGDEYMSEGMRECFLALVFDLSRTRRELRRLPPVDPQIFEHITRTTELVVAWISVELQFFERYQQSLVEEVGRKGEHGGFPPPVVGEYFSGPGKDFGMAISEWARVVMGKADKVVRLGDEHARGERPYVERFIRQNSLYASIQELLDVVEPVISWTKFSDLEESERNSPSIFISYRRHDSQAVTGRIYDRLCRRFDESSIFLDIDAMPLGIDFRDHLRVAIGKADVLLAIIGESWRIERTDGSERGTPVDFVRIELELAVEQGIPIIPVLIDRTPIPREEALPNELASLRYLNAITIDSGMDFHTHMSRLIRALEKLLRRRRMRRAFSRLFGVN